MSGRSGSKHPDASTLALYAEGDLLISSRLRMRLHVARCSICEKEVAAFRATLRTLRRAAESENPAACDGNDWQRLEREMIGNIAVGVDAARCIENVGYHHRIASTGALLMAGLSILFVIGWFTHIPWEQNQHLISSLRRIIGVHPEQSQNILLQTTPTGIAVHTQGATLTMMHPSSALVTVSGASAVTARYVDEDTGQVTITKVYGQ